LTFIRDRVPDPLAYFESQGLTLQRGGKWRSTACVFCDSKRGLRINTDSGGWICMACGEKGGDVVAFHMRLHGMEFVEAAQALGAWEKTPHSGRQAPWRPLPFRARDGLEVLREEAMLTAVAAGNQANGVVLTDIDRQRLWEAARRIVRIVEATAP
jgi:hypothetical protein